MKLTLTDNEGTVLGQWPIADVMPVGKFEALLAHALSSSDLDMSQCEECSGFFPWANLFCDDVNGESYCGPCWIKKNKETGND